MANQIIEGYIVRYTAVYNLVWWLLGIVYENWLIVYKYTSRAQD